MATNHAEDGLAYHLKKIGEIVGFEFSVAALRNRRFGFSRCC